MNVHDRIAVAADASVLRPERSSVWTTHLIGLGLLVGLLGVVNAPAISAAVQVWWISPTFTHCFFVIPFSAYFVWRRRPVLARLTPSAYPLALWLALPLVLFSVAGKLAHINEVEQLAFVGLVQVFILTILGPQVYRAILFPSLFLFFLVPMGEYLIAPLQDFTTHFISAGLTVLKIPHQTEANVIRVSTGVFEVDEACAGLRFLIATIAMGVLFVHLTYRKWYKITLYLAASVVLPVIANGSRALGIVLLGYWSDNRIAHGVDHIVYGWFFLVAILLALMIIGMRYADPIAKEGSGEAVVALAQRPRAFAPTMLLSLAAVMVVPGLLYWQSHRPFHIDTALLSTPLSLPGWQTGVVSGGWSPNPTRPDAHLAFAMHEPTSFADVDVFVNYYVGGKASQNLLSASNSLWDENVWHLLSQGTAEAELSGRRVRLKEEVIGSAGLIRIVWWTYWSGGRFTTSGLDVRLDRIRQILSGGGSALVAVSTPVFGNAEEARARLRRALADLGGIQTRLNEADRS